MKERKTVTKALAAQYRRARKGEKGHLLKQFVEATGYNRCHAAWLLRNHGARVEVIPKVFFEGDARQRGGRGPRKKRYGDAAFTALKKVWVILDYLCGKRLKAALPEVVPNLVASKELRIAKPVQKQLLAMSASTIDRALKSERAKHMLKGRAHTKPGTLLKHQVPFRTFSDWDDNEPGFLEMDLVGHEGGTAQGDHCFTLDLTDVATGWTELAAVPNKAEKWVFEALQAIRRRLPFAVRGLDSDNGSEFINHHLIRFCREEKITFTRSRPYRKNDNCYVEQKNWSVVRRFVGYGRYDTRESLVLLNEMCLLLRDYVNYFLPSMKLKEKSRNGARVQRRHHPALTPYHRLLQSNVLSPAEKKTLEAYYHTLNVAQLHRQIRQCQNKLSTLATPVQPIKTSLPHSCQSEVGKKTGARPSRKKARPAFVLAPGTALGSHSCVALSSAQVKPIVHKKRPKSRSRFK
jgi:hypothetical protein